MFYTYILHSATLDRYYIGYSENPEKRLAERHNVGSVKATRAGIPYVLKKKKAFESELEAVREERRLKKMKSRLYLERIIAGTW